MLIYVNIDTVSHTLISIVQRGNQDLQENQP